MTHPLSVEAAASLVARRATSVTLQYDTRPALRPGKDTYLGDATLPDV